MKNQCITLIEHPMDTPPLGSAYLVGSLRAHGYETSHIIKKINIGSKGNFIIDINNPLNNHINVIPIVTKIKAYSPQIIFFSCYSYNRTSTLAVIKFLKNQFKSLVIVCGGPDIHYSTVDKSNNGIDLYKNYADYLIQGEGEFKIIYLLESLKNGSNPTLHKDIYSFIHSDNKEIKCGQSERIEDLDKIPFPDFTDISFNIFKPYNFFRGIPLYLSRGCSHNSCTFCDRYERYDSIRFRTAQNIYSEILTQSSRHNTNNFIVVDDDPFSTKAMNEIQNLLTLLINDKNNYSIEIYNARMSAIYKDDFAEKLKKAGITRIRFGLESFSQNVRTAMRKSVSDETVKNVLINFSKAGIKTDIFMIYAYPTESNEDFNITLQHLYDLKNYINHVFFNIFILNSHYGIRQPQTYIYLGTKSKDMLTNWESNLVNPEVMWERFTRLKFFLNDNYYLKYNLLDPSGKYYLG